MDEILVQSLSSIVIPSLHLKLQRIPMKFRAECVYADP